MKRFIIGKYSLLCMSYWRKDRGWKEVEVFGWKRYWYIDLITEITIMNFKFIIRRVK